MNVLLTCAGRRNYLIQYFREALNGNGYVYASDASADAPAMQEADKAFVLPPVHSHEYIKELLAICSKHNVRILISLNDLELPLLAMEREHFLSVGTIPVISSPFVVDTCFDKWETTKYLTSVGVSVPKTYLSLEYAIAAISRGEVSFPLVLKPRWGTASIGIEYADNTEIMKQAYVFVKRRVMDSFLQGVSSADPSRCVIIQEKLSGHEYGLDIVNDLSGKPVCTFVKRKLGMRAGETSHAVTVENEELCRIGAVIGKSLGHVGNLDCDAFVSNKGIHVLEMNPRFGGGYPFSHVAGANLPAALIAWANGEDADPSWLSVAPNVTSAKCDRLVICGHRG